MNFVKTDDGSLTLRNRFGETMHSQKGALGETLYVYGKAIEMTLQLPPPWNFLIVGTGLGYIELALSTIVQKLEIKENHLIKIVSLESDDHLKDLFLSWVQRKVITENFQRCFDFIESQLSSLIFSQYFALLNMNAIREWLHKKFQNGSWQFQGDLFHHLNSTHKYNSILYDPYSSLSLPELWDEKHLHEMLLQFSNSSTVFSSYSAKSSLKRALIKNGYQLIKRKGFGNKRECTLAILQT